MKRDSVEDEGDKMSSGRSVIKVFLVNGESRSVRLDERMEVTVRPKRSFDLHQAAKATVVIHKLVLPP